MRTVLDDLADERAETRRIVEAASESDLDVVTPAAPWTVRDQIAHLAAYDEEALLAVTDPEAFAARLPRMADLESVDAEYQDRAREMSKRELVDWLDRTGSALIEALTDHDPDERVLWYGPPMRARSFAVARLMETWAHTQDIADGLRVDREPTDRLFHVAELGIRTFRFSFENRGLAAPETRVRVALRGPTGTVRVWNDEFDDSVTGPLEEFCLVVAQRRHIDDTHLVVEGAVAAQWMSIAQVFAGPPGPGREASTDTPTPVYPRA